MDSGEPFDVVRMANRSSFAAWIIGWMAMGGALASSAPMIVSVPAPAEGPLVSAVPVSLAVDLARMGLAAKPSHRWVLTEDNSVTASSPVRIPVQFQTDVPGLTRGQLCWLLPSGTHASRRFLLSEEPDAGPPIMRVAADSSTGRWNITDGDRPVLGYQYGTNQPGDLLARIAPGNLKYARARGDYIHPLHGLDGTVLTLDWPIDHPHHRGIYWAWPEVDYRGQRGDLHALQRVFARPTGHCVGRSGPVFAEIEAENVWLWEDRDPIVRERARIRAYHAEAKGRIVDLEFHISALVDDVSLARRETTLYGGLNLRLAPVTDQRILFHTDPVTTNPRAAWARLFGAFAGGKGTVGLAVLQNPRNPDYPGDWIQYPEINWFQPTFPAAGTRYLLRKSQTLVLRFRLWIHAGDVSESEMAGLWATYTNPPQASFVP